MNCEECGTRNVDVLPSLDPDCQTCLKARLNFLDRAEYIVAARKAAWAWEDRVILDAILEGL